MAEHMVERRQYTFNSVDYGFEWTTDWYTWDMVAGQKAALKERNAKARELRKAGWTVWVSTSDSLFSQGGIGSGHPHIELWGKTYRVNAAQ